jgi:hypothetical protein
MSTDRTNTEISIHALEAKVPQNLLSPKSQLEAKKGKQSSKHVSQASVVSPGFGARNARTASRQFRFSQQDLDRPSSFYSSKIASPFLRQPAEIRRSPRGQEPLALIAEKFKDPRRWNQTLVAGKQHKIQLDNCISTIVSQKQRKVYGRDAIENRFRNVSRTQDQEERVLPLSPSFKARPAPPRHMTIEVGWKMPHLIDMYKFRQNR